MNLTLMRYSSGSESTLGLLTDDTRGLPQFLCYTLEDEKRDIKVAGKTRIPSGRYEVVLRSEEGFHNRYLTKFGSEFHKGMLWVKDVPEFSWILIHMGNNDDHTEGCILVGNTTNENITKDGFIGDSEGAYRRIYPKVRDALLSGEKVYLKILNMDTI